MNEGDEIPNVDIFIVGEIIEALDGVTTCGNVEDTVADIIEGIIEGNVESCVETLSCITVWKIEGLVV